MVKSSWAAGYATLGALVALCVSVGLADYRSSNSLNQGVNDYRDLSEQDYDMMLDDTPRDEVERLLRDYQQNQDFIRNLGNRFYQIIYPIQVRQRERFGVSTREIENSYGKVMCHKY